MVQLTTGSQSALSRNDSSSGEQAVISDKKVNDPVVDDFVQRFKFGKDFVVIADAYIILW